VNASQEATRVGRGKPWPFDRPTKWAKARDGFAHLSASQEATLVGRGKPWPFDRPTKWAKARDGFAHVKIEKAMPGGGPAAASVLVGPVPWLSCFLAG
jgi:hypothetical protein